MKTPIQHSYVDYISENDFNIHHTVTKPNPKSLKWETEIHSDIELLFLLSGKLDYIINGETFRVHEGDLIIVNANTPHALTIAANYAYERIVLQFSPKHIPVLKNCDLCDIFTNSANYRHVIPKEILKDFKVESLLKKMCKTSKKQIAFKDVEILALITELIAELSYTVSKLNTLPDLLLKPRKQNTLLQNIITYINKRINEKITVEEIAHEFNVSTSYLYQFFKKHTQLSLHNYIEKQKMQYAKLLILQGSPATLVSTYLGFDYYATFCNQYKRVFGISPNKHFSNK